MLIHVKPDKNHRPTYIYEDDRKHPDLPPGAITVGDVFHAIGQTIKCIIITVQVIVALAFLAYSLFFSRILNSSALPHIANGIIIDIPKQ